MEQITEHDRLEINAIADRIEEKGWFNLRTGMHDSEDSCCVITAFIELHPDISLGGESYDTMREPLFKFADWLNIERSCLGLWNDSHHSKEPVIAALREFANQ